MSFHLSMADNVGAIRRWHQHAHPGDWAGCVYEPCNVTEPEWRKAWGEK